MHSVLTLSEDRREKQTTCTHLLFRFHIELIPGNELQDILKGQGQELLGHGDLHEVLVDEAVGSVVEHRAHHGLGKLPHTQAVLGMKPGKGQQESNSNVRFMEEKLWLPLDPWKCSRPGWTLGFGAAWDSGRCPCHGRGWNGLCFKVFSKPNHSRILGSTEALQDTQCSARCVLSSDG